MRWCSLWLLLLPCVTTAATWYWRPNSAIYGDQSGSSYTNAWNQEPQINWAAMRDGDTLLVCGRHDTGYLDRGLNTGRGNITISGDCRGDPGEIISVGTRFTPKSWTGPNADGVYQSPYSGSPGSAMDEIGQLQLLNAIPSAKSPCRSYFHAAGILYYRPCGVPLLMYPTGGGPVVGIHHSGVTLENLLIRNGSTGVEIVNATGVKLRQLRIIEHTGIGILLSGRTSDGLIQYNEIQHVTDGIYAVAGGEAGSTDRHNRWLVEGNLIHDIAGSGDAHGIGWQSGSDNVFRRNFILRAAGSGITMYAWRHQENSRNVIEDNVILNVVRKSVEGGQRGIELSGDSCWDSPENRRGDVIRNNIIENVSEGIYVKAVPSTGTGPGARIEGNRIMARDTGIRWANPNGGLAPDLPMERNEIKAPRPLKQVTSASTFCR